jgi:hypothetical protein
MVEYSEGEAGRAREIAEALLAEETPRFELEDGLSIIDVEAHAAEFRGDLAILSHFGTDVPSLRIGDGDPVPVSLSYLTFEGFPFQPRFYGARRWRLYPRSILFEMEAEYVSRAIREIKGWLRTYRGARNDLGGNSSHKLSAAGNRFPGHPDFNNSRIRGPREWSIAPTRNEFPKHFTAVRRSEDHRARLLILRFEQFAWSPSVLVRRLLYLP